MINNPTRITGMVSGLDVDSLVKQMMKVETMKVDKAKQDRQMIQWKQDAYRDIIGDLNTLKSTYFDVLKSDSYLLSSTNYSSFDVTSSDTTNSIITATGVAGATAGTYALSNISLATKAALNGTKTFNVRQGSTVQTPVYITTGSTSAGDGTTTPITSNNLHDSIDNILIKDSSGTTLYSGSVALTDGRYNSLADVAKHINDQFAATTINSSTKLSDKLYATVSADGTQIQFQSPTSDTITIGGNTLANSSTPSYAILPEITSTNNSLNFRVNGTNTAITLTSRSYSNVNDLVSEINTQISNAGSSLSGAVQAKVGSDGKSIQFAAVGTDSINVSGSAIGTLGFNSNGIDINQSIYDKMSNLVSGPVSFKITANGVTSDLISFDFSGADKDKSISDVMTQIESKANVDVSYSELTREFSITSKTTGASQSISVQDVSGGFFSTLFGNTTATPGQDAHVTIQDPSGNSNTVYKSTNNFTVDGVNYNLLKNSAGPINVTLTPNVQKSFDKIKAFVDKYNDIIGKINGKLEEKKLYDYQPLTDDQKSSMKDTDITAWNDKAQQGILKGDTALNGLVTGLRSAFYNSNDYSTFGISLSQIGLSTSSDVSERGKIIIDETKLKDALQNQGDKVQKLLAQSSFSKPYYDPDASNADRTTRTNEEGIFQRINDALSDYVRTTRNSRGDKGILLVKAGVKGDFSEVNNLLSKQLMDQDNLIKDLSQKANDKENDYYNQFSKLEQAMQNFNSQSQWLTQQLGGGR